MPKGLSISSYDIVRPPLGQNYASRALRRIDVPINGTALTAQVTPVGIGMAMQAFDGPNPVSGAGGCQDDYCGNELGIVASKFSLYVMSLQTSGGNPNPPGIIFQVRVGSGNVVTARFTGTFAANNFDFQDLLVQVSGLNGTQFEIIVRIDPSDPNAAPVSLYLAANLSPWDDADGTHNILGPNTTAGTP